MFFYIVKDPVPVHSATHSLPNTPNMSIAMHSACSKHRINVLSKNAQFYFIPRWRPTSIAEISTSKFFLTVNNSTLVFEGIQSCAKNVTRGLSRISNRSHVANFILVTPISLTWVVMWDRFFRQRAS